MGITETCSRLIGGLVQAIRVVGVSRSNPNHDHDNDDHQAMHSKRRRLREGKRPLDDTNSMQARALVTVFGMQDDGTIRKEKAREVVARLGLLRPEEDDDDQKDQEAPSSPGAALFELPGDTEEVVAAAQVLGGGAAGELPLRQAFKIFDEDGNGFIDAVELKRVLECLGLDCGWGMDEIEKMLKAVDLNSDGKVDFREFEVMMMGNSIGNNNNNNNNNNSH